jgi:L-rhamnose isomerase
LNPLYIKDAVEGKLFGIGSESCVIGSHDFYYGYVMQHKEIMLCMDMGHYHPTENVGEKIPSYFQFKDELLLHLSRGVRWDSDHVVIINEDLMNVIQEIVRANVLNKVHLALDFFDASINRIGAWVVGARAVLKALLFALLEPVEHIIKIEECGNNFKRLAMLEDLKSMPYGVIWEYYCMKHNVPTGTDYIEAIMDYENTVLAKRSA